MKRTELIALLLILANMQALVGCGSENREDTLLTTPAPDQTSEAAQTYPVPEADFGGETFGILSRSEKKYEVWSDSEDGETLNDAIYKRNRNVEERYKIKIECYDTPGGWSDRENFYKVFTGSVLAGEDKYDLVAYYEALAQIPITEGYMLDLTGIKSLDFSNEWWYPGYNDVMTVNGKLYSCLGDVAVSTWESPAVTFFNKALMKRYGMEYPYQAVKDGKWTFDMLCELGKQVSDDLNGDGKFDENDLYGWLTSDEMLRCMSTSFEFPLCVTDGGKPKLNIGSEKYYEVYERAYDTLWNNDWATILKGTNGETRTKCFTDGNVLFYSCSTGYIDELRGMNDDFGILPYPKYNEEQEDYHTVVFDSHSVFCIPKTVKDPERSGLVLEALGYESMKIVTPAYYEILLNGKVARDDESRDMLDIIRDSFQFDFAIVNSAMLSSIFSFYGVNLSNEVESIASQVASKLPVWEEKFETLLEFYEYN